MVHRDIKPANLISSTVKSGISNAHGVEAVVKVLDMGLARLNQGVGEHTAADRTVEGAVMGTPDYMAPEQAENSSNADIRADVYSLGCTLYFLLTGQPPFPGGTMAQKLLRISQSQPTSITELRKGSVPAEFHSRCWRTDDGEGPRRAVSDAGRSGSGAGVVGRHLSLR